MKLGKDPSGVYLLYPDGRKVKVPNNRVNIDDLGVPLVNETVRSSYSVRFFDIGAPVHIEAPAGAIPVEGKG